MLSGILTFAGNAHLAKGSLVGKQVRWAPSPPENAVDKFQRQHGKLNEYKEQPLEVVRERLLEPDEDVIDVNNPCGVQERVIEIKFPDGTIAGYFEDSDFDLV
jgi:hypothetical protein